MDFAVPIAFVNGDKLADLALEFELEIQPSIDDLLSVLVNREDVETIIRTPVRLSYCVKVYFSSSHKY